MCGRDDTGLSLSRCRLCPRCCEIDRRAGRRGYCRAGDTLEVYRVAPHHGEEPPLSGARGSGTIFFSRCTLRCGYCQNYPWSQEAQGCRCSLAEFVGQLKALHAQGCHNWNLVSPTPWLPLIAAGLDAAKKDGVMLPVVYNTSGFEREEVLEDFGGYVDIYLPDLRYADERTARLASDADGYVAAARCGVGRMWEQAGPLRVNRHGVAVSGVICRILVLPGHAHEAVESLEWLADTTHAEVAVSVMSQYHPAYRAADGRLGAGWERTIRAAEYETVCSAVERLGFRHGWVQDFGHETAQHLLGCNMAEGMLPPGSGQEDNHERTQ